ncbi:hypothetical protein MP228_001571 [Amoeboaphelidium protococcarum]|nr:hypothetical protein MP228_001571 [Amoeboaphelidium protococcarum]
MMNGMDFLGKIKEELQRANIMSPPQAKVSRMRQHQHQSEEAQNNSTSTKMTQESGSRFICRKVASNDIDQLRQFNEELFPVKYQKQYYDDLLRQEKQWRKDDDFMHVIAFIVIDRRCENGNPIVASIGCRIQYGQQEGHHAYIMSLGVRPQYRNKGFARHLMRKVLSMIRSQEINVSLDVLPSNEAAINLYRSFNFVVSHINVAYYTIDGQEYDSLHMIKYHKDSLKEEGLS